MIEVLKQALEALKDVGVLTDREWQAVHKNKANELRQAIAELESQERNFCQRCGKRLGGIDSIHTCTPPQGIYYTPPQRTEPPAWFPAVENILNEYGLQAIDFVADFKAAMKDAEQSQRTWVGLSEQQRNDIENDFEVFVSKHVFDAIEAKLKEKNT
jgi:hypothetical protein